MTATKLLRAARKKLESSSPSAALDARLLLCYLLKIEPLELFRNPERQLTVEQQQAFLALIERRHNGEPVAYLVGYKAFYNHDFVVTKDTLIPRPETELLVDCVLSLIPQQGAAVIADLGTGSGAIAITLALERPNCQLVAIDQSQAALMVARNNAARLLAVENTQSGAQGGVEFGQGSWLKGVERQFDIIVSNPPYVADDDVHLTQGDVRFEPRLALVAAEQGMAAFEQIASQSAARLVAQGWLLVEHGYQQGEKLRELFQRLGFTEISTHRDLAGQERVTQGQWPGH